MDTLLKSPGLLAVLKQLMAEQQGAWAHVNELFQHSMGLIDFMRDIPL